MHDKSMEFVLPLAELIDRLTVDQIKEVLVLKQRKSIQKEIEGIAGSIDHLLKKKKIKFDSRMIRVIVALSQMNLHIWFLKDRLTQDKRSYAKCLKLSHQLNGIRNQLKNLLLVEAGDREASMKRLNSSTDGLKGWTISLLEMKR